MGYLPVYYPNAFTVTRAAALCVDTGGENVVEFHLRPRSTFQVRGKLEILSGLRRDFEPLIGLRNENGDLVNHFRFNYDRDSQGFVLGRLSPGSYEIELRAGIYDSDPVAHRTFTISDSDINGFVMRMQVPVQVRAFVRFPGGFAPSKPYSVRVRLERDGVPVRDESGWPIIEAGEVTLPQHFAPGHYGLYLFDEDSVYLKAAVFGAQDALANGLLLDGNTTGTLDLNIATASSAITGGVIDGSESPAGIADVKLIAQGINSPYVVRSVNADSAGRFRIAGVAPGRYDLVALDRTVRDAEFGPREWNQVKRWAKAVNVGDATSMTVDLELAKLTYAGNPCSSSALP
jgi:hypothetical protein